MEDAIILVLTLTGAISALALWGTIWEMTPTPALVTIIISVTRPEKDAKVNNIELL